MKMTGISVREQMGWDASYGFTALVYRAERYFTTLLHELFPAATMTVSVLQESRGIDITLTYAGTTYQIEVEVATRAELLPPIHLQEALENLERHRRQLVGQKASFLLITNYYLTPIMIERLGDRGLQVLRFGLDDEDLLLRQNLSSMIERFRLAQ